MITRAQKISRSVAAVAFACAFATGCALFVDFSPYDTSDVPPEAAAPDGSIFDAGPPFRIVSVTPSPASWRAGDSITLHVSVARNPSYTDKLSLAVTGLPSGVTAAPTSVAAGGTSGDIVLVAATTAHAGVFHGASVVARTPNGITAERAVDLELAGAPGTLDESFGDGGVISLPLLGRSAVLGMGDEIVVLGTLTDAGQVPPAVVRYSADGTFDSTFGDAGLAVPIGSGGGLGMSIAGDDAGYVVLQVPPAQGQNGVRSLSRIDLEGAPLGDFGEGGTIQYVNRNGGSVQTDREGRALVMTGAGVTGGFSLDWFSADGTLNRHAGGPGRNPLFSQDPEGRVVVLTNGVHVQRLFGDGSVDPTLGDPSDAATGFGSGAGIAVLATAEATFVAADLSPYGLLKLHSDGSVDTTYGTNGFSTETIARFAPADGGALYITRGVAVGKLTPKGISDPSFGSGPDMTDAPVAILVQRTGRIVVVGNATVHRFWP